MPHCNVNARFFSVCAGSLARYGARVHFDVARTVRLLAVRTPGSVLHQRVQDIRSNTENENAAHDAQRCDENAWFYSA